MLNSRQRAFLRKMANTMDMIVHIGKDGISENLKKHADVALTARVLVKMRVLENSALSTREACDGMAAFTKSESVQVIGSRFVLYRENRKLGEKRIKIPD